MSGDFNKPVTTDAYADVLDEIRAIFADLAQALDPAVTTPSNKPTNAIGWSSANKRFEKWNGASWAELEATWSISINGNAATVTNGVYTTGSYSNPAWITALSGSKINSGTVSASYIDVAIARLASPAFTGNPTAPTQAVDNNSTRLATTAYVINQGYLKAAGGTSTNVGNTDQTLTDASSVDWNMNSGGIATLTLSATGGVTRTMNAPTNLKKTTYVLHLIQGDATPRDISWNAVFKWGSGGTPPVLSSGSGKHDVVTFVSDGTYLYGAAILDVA